MAAVVLLSSAALVLGACPAAPAVQDDLSALQLYTAFVDGGGSVHVTPWHDATTPSLQLYEGTDQAVLLFDPTFVPSPPANRVHLRVVSSSAFAVLNTVDPLIEGDPIAIVVCAPYLCTSFDLMNLY